MRSMAVMGAVAAFGLTALSCGGALAEAPRQMFCVAVRTVPVLDQNNYVLGATGPVYMTPNFTTDLPDERLTSAWRSYILNRHPAGYPSNPDDTCYPANTRRALLNDQRGDIKNLSVSWTPAKSAGN